MRLCFGRGVIFVAIGAACIGSHSFVNGDDWPMWRRDAARSAQTAEELPDDLHLRWVRGFPKLKPAYREQRLQFDAGYEPVVLGKSIFIASSRDESVTALDTETGKQCWQFFAEGPVRFAPVAWRDRVVFGSDDGFLYCLNSENGKVVWKFRAVPSERKVLSGGRMISLWPVRGGPVLHDEKIYFAAGVWPFEGVFIYCLDAATGKVVWRNDEASFVYGQHPHDAKAMGGVTPQGYLVVAGDELVVPCGQALPARFDLQTGKLKSFELPKPGRQPGGWFASASVRRGEVTLDAEVNRDLHEDKVYQGPGSPGVRTTIKVGDKTFQFEDGFRDVKGTIHSMLAANGKLFVVTLEGRIYCFGEKPVGSGIQGEEVAPRRVADVDSDAAKKIERILKATGIRNGYALLSGRGNDQPPSDPSKLTTKPEARSTVGLIDALLRQSKYHLVVTDPVDMYLNVLRLRYRDDRDRICLLSEASRELDLPRYFASLLIFDAHQVPTLEDLRVLRPNGGVACLDVSAAVHKHLEKMLDSTIGKGYSIERSGELSIIRRGPLAGAADYTGDWSSPDQLVSAPLGVLWFDDTLGHFKRSPQPWFVEGVMISYPKDWMEKHRASRKPPYDLLPPVFSDVYTGRVLSNDEMIVTGLKFPKRDLKESQPSQYRPPTQRDAWKPQQPIIGERINPLTRAKEPRVIPKSYGCDGGVDYGNIFTMRSGTPAFYDKRLESGVCSISGPRSGCTNSIIPAGGVLNVPFFYEGCTCSYPLPVGLALVSMPQTHEQWSSWGPGKVEDIQRVGINFGAPGDRMTEDGTLWLDYPNRGGPSPDVSVSVEPKSAEFFYQHSLFVKGESVWPWVAASGVEGAETITVAGLRPGTYAVKLYFLEPEHDKAGKRLFDISLNGKAVAEKLDVVEAVGGRMQSLMRHYRDIESKGEIQIVLRPQAGRTILSGVEIVKKGLTVY